MSSSRNFSWTQLSGFVYTRSCSLFPAWNGRYKKMKTIGQIPEKKLLPPSFQSSAIILPLGNTPMRSLIKHLLSIHCGTYKSVERAFFTCYVLQKTTNQDSGAQRNTFRGANGMHFDGSDDYFSHIFQLHLLKQDS